MCPTDTTPDPRGMTRVPESQVIPQPLEDEGGGERPVATNDERLERAGNIENRPEIPQGAPRMPADVLRDRETEPVVADSDLAGPDGELNRR